MRERQRDTAREREGEREREKKNLSRWMKEHRNSHVAQRARMKGVLAEARNPHPSPNLNLHILVRSDER